MVVQGVGADEFVREDPMSLAGLLDDQARIRGDAIAIIDLDRTWTYEETAQARGQLSAALWSSGVSLGDRVGVHCNKGAAGLIAMHAIVSAGAVAVPLDPASPPARLASICNRMGIEVVITHAPLVRSILAIHEQRPFQTVIGAVIDDATTKPLISVGPDEVSQLEPMSPVNMEANEPAYIITTSGSTGEPKGIVHSHSSAVAYAEMAALTYGLDRADRVTDIAPLHFDISTMALWAVPLVGAANVVVSEAHQRLPASHSQLLADHGVTVWYSVPFLLQQLVTRGDLDNRDLTAMRWVHFGGEVITPETISEMMRHCPNARFANIFGPAETNQCTLAVFDSPPPADRSVSIGFPLANTEVRIAYPDADSPTDTSLVGPHEQGEMWTHSPQLMVGYFDRPEANARVLREVEGKRFYRSGDLVSHDGRGELTFHGRVDHQVKVRGFRVELEGIELELEKLGAAEHVIVGVLRAHSNQDELIAGVLNTSADFDESAFLRSAASVLPSYAVPSKIVTLDAPEFTGSGKLDRRALRERSVAACERTL